MLSVAGWLAYARHVDANINPCLCHVLVWSDLDANLAGVDSILCLVSRTFETGQFFCIAMAALGV